MRQLCCKTPYTPSCILGWKRLVVSGLDSITRLNKNSNESDGERVEDWIAKFKGSYQTAMPDYEKKRNKAFSKGDSKLYLNILDIIKSKPHRLKFKKISVLKAKLGALRYYERITAKFSFPNKFVVVFLHFQPERTSLPEGLGYAQQIRLILEVLASLPRDFTLVVKEHPAIFRNIFNRKVRDKSFYEKIHLLPNVLWAPLTLTPFELIKRSSAIITLTGTVAVEAAMKSTPVLFYGVAQYYDMPGVYSASDKNSLRAFYSTLNSQASISVSGEDMGSYCKNIDSVSYFADDMSKPRSPSFRALVEACKW